MSYRVPGAKTSQPKRPKTEADVHLEPAPAPVVVGFPTVMDGWIVRWYATEDAANHGEQVISASRSGVTVHQDGALAESLRRDAEHVAGLIGDFYSDPFGLPKPHEPKPWEHYLTHVKPRFRDVEPITQEASR